MTTLLGYLFFGGVGLTLVLALPVWSALSQIERVALAFALGVGAVTVQLELYGFAGIAWRVPAIVLPWVVALVIVALVRRSLLIDAMRASVPKGRSRRSTRESLSILDLALLAGIICAVALATIIAATHVLGATRGEDAFQQYFLKAKMLYVYGGFSPVLGDHVLWWVANLDHPPLIPLSVLWIYITSGGVHETSGLLLSPLLYACLLGVFYALVRRHASRRLALGLTLLLACAPTGANLLFMGAFSPGYADMPLALYLLCGAGYLHLALTSRGQGRAVWISYLILGGMGLGFASQTKNEGVAFLAMTALATFVVVGLSWRRDKALAAGLLLAVALGGSLALPWVLGRRAYGVALALVSTAAPSSKLGAAAYAAGSMVAHAALYWNVALVAFAVGIIVEWRSARRLSVAFLLILLGGQFCLDIVGQVITPLDIHYEVASTAGRLILQLTPLLLYVIHITLANDATLAALTSVPQSLAAAVSSARSAQPVVRSADA